MRAVTWLASLVERHSYRAFLLQQADLHYETADDLHRRAREGIDRGSLMYAWWLFADAEVERQVANELMSRAIVENGIVGLLPKFLHPEFWAVGLCKI